MNDKARKGFKWGFTDKTGWDWLDLIAKLAIPLILGSATLLLSKQQADLAQQQHVQDQASALDQQRQAVLVKYQDDMRDLLLNKGLLTSKPGDAIRIIALTETISAMRQLDAKRNSFLIRFLQDAHLNGIQSQFDPGVAVPLHELKSEYNIMSFVEANLSSIDFSGVQFSDFGQFSYVSHSIDLSGARLIHTKFSNAYLLGIKLSWADLSRADLSRADLLRADLYQASLIEANFSGADLSEGYLSRANFFGANLSGADLSGANLSGAFFFRANLSRADLSGANLRDAEDLTQKQLDQVSSCRGQHIQA